MSQLLGLFCILSSIALAHIHTCAHDRFGQDPVIVDLGDTEGRFLTGVTWQSIRIGLVTSTLTGGTTAQMSYITNQLLPAAVNYWQATLNIQRLTISLTFQTNSECGITIPSKTYAGYDIVFFVTGANQPSEDFVAYASACSLNKGNYRPISGQINFNYYYVTGTTEYSQFESDLVTTLHEMTHVFCFSSSLYPYYINSTTGALLKNANSTLTANGYKSQIITAQPLLSYVQSYFGAQVAGGLLENEGTSSSAGSHWERRTFYNEYMTAQVIQNQKITQLTLKLFETSGWYSPNYGMAENMFWGKNLGSNFYTGSCMSNGSPTFSPEFCGTIGQIGCSFDSMYKSVCGGGVSATNANLFSAWNYWKNNSIEIDPFSDNCAYQFPYSNGNCEDPANNVTAFIPSGEFYGTGSRCFMGQIGTYGLPSSSYFYCFKSKCILGSNGNYILEVSIGSSSYNCTTSGSVLKVGGGFTGTLNCPNPNIFCAQFIPSTCPRGCMGEGTCQSNNTCKCNSGWTGPDCSMKT